MPQKIEINYPTLAKGGRDGCHKRQTYNAQQWQREGWMPQKAEIKFPTLAEGGRTDATKDRNNISNSGRGRGAGCHKRQK